MQRGNSAKAVRIGDRLIHIPTVDRYELSRFIAKQDRQNIKKLKRLSEAS